MIAVPATQNTGYTSYCPATMTAAATAATADPAAFRGTAAAMPATPTIEFTVAQATMTAAPAKLTATPASSSL